MWIILFIIVLATAICLSVAALMLQDRDSTETEITRLSTEQLSRRTEFVEPDLKTLLANPEVRLVMRSDHVDRCKLLANLDRISAQLKKNANLIFNKALRRLRNMSEMMDRLGFDADALARQDLSIKSVFRACQVCPADKVCQDWLVRAPKSFERAPAFCPNAKRFARAKELTA